MIDLSFVRRARPLILCALVALVLVFGAGNSAWATPLQSSNGQSVPTATPGGPTIPPVTPPPAPSEAGEVREAVAPGVSAAVAAGDSTVVLPANALSAPGTVAVHPVALDQLPPASAGFALLGKAVEITLYDANGQPIEHPTFANPVEVCFAYSASDLAQAGGSGEALVVQFYDVSAAKWVSLPTQADPAKGQACGSATHFTLFGLVARSDAGVADQAGAPNQPSRLPKTGDNALTEAPIWIWAAIALVLALGVAAAIRARQLHHR